MISKICSSYGKIKLYARPKITTTKPHGGGWFKWKLKFLGIFLALISFSNSIFSKNTFALYTPTLSASVDSSDVTVSGNDVINTYSKTSFNSMNLTVKTNNRTGYTAVISTETDDTSLKNLDSTLGAKIQSITENLALNNFTANTWGYKMGSENNFKPIPAASNPSNIIQTAVGTGYNETNKINIGIKLSDTLESGNYTNKIIVSVVSNPYEKKARINRGYDFNTSVGNLDKNQTIVDRKGKRDNIYHIKRSSIAKDLIPADAVNIENGSTSDYEVKIWFVPSENTVYYWTEADKITLSKDSSFMFDRMSKLQTIDLSGFDTSEAEGMSRMFAASPELKSLDLSGFNTSKVKNMTYMFYDAGKIETLDLSAFDTSNVTTMYGLFNGMRALKNLNISSFNTQNVTEMQEMFQYNSSLTSLDLSHFDTRKVTNMKSMFNGVSNVVSLDLSNFDTSKVTDMNHMFHLDSKLTSLNISGFGFDTSNVTNMESMFSGLQELTTLNVTNFNTSKVTNMASMFYNTAKLTNLDVRNFNTENVTNMRYMFSFMTKLTTLDLSNFRTGKVTTMEAMFREMPALTTLNIDNFDTRNVDTMREMFLKDVNLANLNLSSFDTRKVTDMGYMFYGMKKINSLDLSNFVTSKVTDMYSMFFNTYNLKTLDISNFETGALKDARYIFYTDGAVEDKLERIYVNNDFDTSNLVETNGMFINRRKLRGGNGSYLSDPATADKTWLRVDRPGVQGYFTRKS